jgi:hypothetical protein
LQPITPTMQVCMLVNEMPASANDEAQSATEISPSQEQSGATKHPEVCDGISLLFTTAELLVWCCPALNADAIAPFGAARYFAVKQC